MVKESWGILSATAQLHHLANCIPVGHGLYTQFTRPFPSFVEVGRPVRLHYIYDLKSGVSPIKVLGLCQQTPFGEQVGFNSLTTVGYLLDVFIKLWIPSMIHIFTSAWR